jgi:hypothetical protein
MAEELPEAPPTALPSLDLTYKPLYEYRDNNEWAAAAHPQWAGKLGYNGPSAHGVTPNSAVTYAGGLFVHTSYALLGSTAKAGDLAAGECAITCRFQSKPAQRCVRSQLVLARLDTERRLMALLALGQGNCSSNSPPADLWHEHRDWFWPQGDGDGCTYGQLCWSNQGLLAHLTEQVKKTLRGDPDANIISLSQNDNGNYCNTSEEFKIMQEEGTPGGALYRAVNQVADAIKGEFPNIAVDTLAYQWSRPAPVQTKPKPNVIIRLCPGPPGALRRLDVPWHFPT